MNGEPLDLMDDMRLPDLNPEVVTDSDGLKLKLAAGNIGFWVVPNAKVNMILSPIYKLLRVRKYLYRDV